MKKLKKTGAIVACIAALAAMAAVPGVAAGAAEITKFEGAILAADGSPATQAGGHPALVRTTIEVATVPGVFSPKPAEDPKNFIIDVPAGLMGNTLSIPRCTTTEIAGSMPTCAAGSQVGLVRVLDRGMVVPVQLFNMVPRRGNAQAPGVPATFAFNYAGVVVNVDAGVGIDARGDYALRMTVRNISQGLSIAGASTDIWGVPADPMHDVQRCAAAADVGEGEFRCTGAPGDPVWGPNPSGEPRTPMLSLPTNCGAEKLEFELQADSWDAPGVFDSASFDTDSEGNLLHVSGCEAVPFQASSQVSIDSQRADAPTGLTVDLEVAQPAGPDSLAAAHLANAIIELPEGLAVNPSAANGLGSCAPSQIGMGEERRPSCPDNSKIGSVEVDSPLLESNLRGAVYLAEQGTNPFQSLLAFYLVMESPEEGVLIKLAGEISPDEETGKLTAFFSENPELPFNAMTVALKGGPFAPVVTPSTCGVREARTILVPWSAADPLDPSVSETRVSSSPIEITRAADGGQCASTPGARPFEPGMAAGLKNASADSFSPFSFRLTRPDGHQELEALELRMPQGVTSKLAGVDYCPDDVLAQVSGTAGTGAAENKNPSCPSNSRVGSAMVGVGPGSNPFYVQTGKAYLAGPYKGAPLSLAIVVPSLAGPLDLGTTVVRNKIDVDRRTAQITLTSDPLPQILHGIPLKLRDIRVNVNREGFMKAPTNCDPMELEATATGSHGATANLTNRFQVGDCASLGFSPDLDLSFGNAKKNTKANSHPQLDAKLHFNEGDANISSVEVALPQGVFLDQERLGRICSRANYAAETCPEESVVGYAKATTPLLDDPVEGPVYLKASDNPLPDLAADLNGQIDIDLFGKIDQKQNKKGLNQIRNTFDVVPDVPVSDFELTLEGGDEGLLVNSRNICKSKKAQKVSIDMVAHNEMTTSSKPLIGSACQKINKKKASKLKAKAKKLLAKAKKADDKTKAKQLRKQARKLKKQARKLGR